MHRPCPQRAHGLSKEILKYIIIKEHGNQRNIHIEYYENTKVGYLLHLGERGLERDTNSNT